MNKKTMSTFVKLKINLEDLTEKQTKMGKKGSKAVRKEISDEIARLKVVIKKNDEGKLTKKTSLLVALFNESMNIHGVRRENYFGQQLNGNNSRDFLKRHNKIFATFRESTKVNYPIFPLENRVNKYEDLFTAYLKVFDLVNHSRPMNDEECDEAQRCIDIYATKLESFGWTTKTNKVE